MSYITLSGAHLYIHTTIKATRKLLNFLILRGYFGRIFRKKWWYPYKIDRKIDGETNEGSKINLNYFFSYLCLKVSSHIKQLNITNS